MPGERYVGQPLEERVLELEYENQKRDEETSKLMEKYGEIKKEISELKAHDLVAEFVQYQIDGTFYTIPVVSFRQSINEIRGILREHIKEHQRVFKKNTKDDIQPIDPIWEKHLEDMLNKLDQKDSKYTGMITGEQQIAKEINDGEKPSKKSGRKTFEQKIKEREKRLKEKEPTEDKSIKVDLGIPASVICSKCGKMIAVMEYMARKNNYKNQMCLKCTKDKELSKKGCFNCEYFIDYDLCNERDMESYEEFMYSTFLTAICNNWKEKEPTEYQQTENVVMHDGIVCKSCSAWFFGEKCIDNKISVEKVDLEDFIIMIKLKLEEMKTFVINKEFVPIVNIINKLIKIMIEKQKKYFGDQK